MTNELPARHCDFTPGPGVTCARCGKPFGHPNHEAPEDVAAERDRLDLLDFHAPWEQETEGPTCSICDGLGHGYPGAGPCPIESPDPLYYADEMAAGR